MDLIGKPDVSVVHYFIATSHDYLGEYPEALASYEKFLATADAATNQLEINKVKLRLPSLRRRIQLGEGVRRKTPDRFPSMPIAIRISDIRVRHYCGH